MDRRFIGLVSNGVLIMNKNRDNHNILIFVLKSGEKMTYSFPFSTQREQAIKQCLTYKEFNPDLVHKVLWFNDTKDDLATFGDYYNPESGEVRIESHLIEQKIQKLKTSRLKLLQKLDIEMIKLLEKEDCELCKKRISKIKQYLRDIPDLIRNFDCVRAKDINNFNVYDNVIEIYIDNPGKGYDSPPVIEIEKPNGHPLKKGFPMKAEAVIEDGSIKDVKVTSVGSSYVFRPKVTVSAPDQEDGEQAVLIAALPENNINLPPNSVN